MHVLRVPNVPGSQCAIRAAVAYEVVDHDYRFPEHGIDEAGRVVRVDGDCATAQHAYDRSDELFEDHEENIAQRSRRTPQPCRTAQLDYFYPDATHGFRDLLRVH